ncbi:MAG: fasciclin domain-containing protein [Pseudonocardiaceae bacterium]|nr:fasciclin domain-containing protein [Pseudonocardiaceae bacterium]
MRKIQRLAAVGALAGLTVVLGACSSGEEPAAGGGNGGEATQAAPEPQEPPTMEQSPEGASGETTIEDIFGPGCDQVPTDPNDPGSAQGMVDDPVGTAASNNPLLTTLTDTVTAANLVDTLNDPEASYTVFAPTNGAFEALEAENPGITEELLAEPEGTLTTVLTYHVIGERYDAAGLVEAGEVMSVEGSMVPISGTPDAPTIGEQNANVACGNVPTANATVFLIDQVLMPPEA